MSGRYGEPWREGKGFAAVISDDYLPGACVCRRRGDGGCPHACRNAYGGDLIGESMPPEIRERIILLANAFAGVSNETLRAHIARGGYSRIEEARA